MAESDGSRKDRPIGWLLVIPVIIVAALVFNGLDPAGRRSQLYFLDAHRTKLVAESRNLSLMGSMEERATQVLDELLLGPFDQRLQPLFKQDVRLFSIMHRGNRLYVDISIPDIGALDVPFGLILEAFEKTLSSSVPGAGVLELDVNGTPVRIY